MFKSFSSIFLLYIYIYIYEKIVKKMKCYYIIFCLDNNNPKLLMLIYFMLIKKLL